MQTRSKSLDFLGFPSYSVTYDGNILNKEGKALKSCDRGKKGYQVVTLYNNGTKKNVSVHQVVALAFLDNPNNHDTVDHKDNDPRNNHADNLQWMANEKNASKSWSAGNHDFQKKTVKQMKDGEVVREYESIAHASREIGVHFSTISRACKNGWQCKGYDWSFTE